ncbi:MAG: M20/M25/M40 family metallo-hydrolase [Candidatus Eisenbacteria bacterium]
MLATHRYLLRRLLAAACCLLLPALALAGPLTSREQRAIAAVDHRLPAALALLQRLVEINSGTLNRAGVREVGRMLEPEFTRLGFRTRWAEGAAWQRAGHLLAERAGRRGSPKVLLIGHLDTVFERDSPFQHFAQVDDSTARGPGIIDMKGGDMILLLALQGMADAGVIDDVSFQVVLTGDEERSGSPDSLARADLVAAGKWADVAIGFEDGDGHPQHAVIARRGSTDWTLRTSGTPAHSSQIFREDIGSGAIYEATRILQAFHDSLGHEPYLTLNPGLLLGGTRITLTAGAAEGKAAGKSNVIAESTYVSGDLRTLTLEQRARALRTMQRIVKSSPPHSSAALQAEDGYPPLAPTDGNRRLLALYDSASRDLGLGAVTAVDPQKAGAADISHVGGLVEMALDGIGLRGDGGHTVNETANMASLPRQAKRATLLLMRLPTALSKAKRR